MLPYVLPLFLLAVGLMAFKAYYQGLALVLIAPYIVDGESFAIVVVFTAGSVFLGKWMAGTSGND